MRKTETEPSPRAAIDHALDELDTTAAGKRQKQAPQLNSAKLLRMFNQSSDPASSQWADAHAYRQTVPERTTEELLDDYRAFPDPTDDGVGRQNATLKRAAVLDEIGNRFMRGEIGDLRLLKDNLGRALSTEPDPLISMSVAEYLYRIAKRSDRGVRTEIVELFENRLPAETNYYARATLETFLKEMKAD